jgi:hypothetical protein
MSPTWPEPNFLVVAVFRFCVSCMNAVKLYVNDADVLVTQTSGRGLQITATMRGRPVVTMAIRGASERGDLGAQAAARPRALMSGRWPCERQLNSDPCWRLGGDVGGDADARRGDGAGKAAARAVRQLLEHGGLALAAGAGRRPVPSRLAAAWDG